MTKLFAKYLSAILMLLISNISIAAIPNIVNGQPVPSLAPMLQKVMPAVVNLQTIGKSVVGGGSRNPFYQQRTRRHRSIGSGIIVDAANGYILTNNHVISKATRIRVILHDKRIFFAKIIGRDPKTDIAVIQIKATNLTAMKMGNSDRVRVGDFVVAIGNAYGLQNTVTSGIISALGRTLGRGQRVSQTRPYQDFLQTDAPINPGNSGGALVSMNGELIGINTAIISPRRSNGKSSGSIGLGFAIPINMARTLMKQLVNFGEVRRGQLGVLVKDLTPKIAKALRAPSTKGALVTQILSGSSAASAGLKAGDIIVSINGKKVGDAHMLRNSIGVIQAGKRIRLAYLRDGRQANTSAILRGKGYVTKSPGATGTVLAGAQIASIPPQFQRYAKAKGVVVVRVRPDSRAWNSGIRRGDIITSINRRKVNGMASFKRVLRNRQGTLLLNIRRGADALFLYLD